LSADVGDFDKFFTTYICTIDNFEGGDPQRNEKYVGSRVAYQHVTRVN
jgi:hypothetical protein